MKSKNFENANIEIKTYLARSEMSLIINTALSDNGGIFDKLTVAEILLIKLGTNLEENYELDIDLIYESGLIYEIKEKVKNYHEVEEYIKETNNLVGVAQSLVTGIINKIPEGKELQKIVNKLVKSVDKVMEDEKNRKMMSNSLSQLLQKSQELMKND